MNKIFSTTALTLLFVPSACLVHAADHLDAPALQAANIGDRDINDLYVFQSPTNPDNSVLILTVNPLAGLANPFFPAARSRTTFGTDVVYELNIDNDDDQIADVTYRTTFGPAVGGVQAFTVTSGSATVAAGTTGQTSVASGVSATAGLFEDPFFFDLVAFNNGLSFTDPGSDTFAGLDVSAIVLEVPSSALNGADSNIGVWARTTDLTGTTQFDRMGRPAINTALIPSARKDEYNQAAPTDNPANVFTADVQASIESLNGGDSTAAASLTDFLLPDVLTFDTSTTVMPGFPNGRQLQDDVIDTALTLITNSPTPIGDGVNANDVPFPGQFPYLAPANIPEPSAIALAVLGLSAIGCRRRRNRT